MYRAESKRKKNAYSGAVIMPSQDNDFMLFFLSKDGLPLSGSWHDTLEEAQSEAREVLGIEAGDWVEVAGDLPALTEAEKATSAAIEAFAATGAEIPEPEIDHAALIEKYKDEYGIDLTDEAYAPDPVDEVDVGSLSEACVRNYEICAEYHQFYIWDISVDPGTPTDYTDDDCVRRVKAAEQCVVIMPERDDTVPVHFEVRPDEPQRDDDAWDHVVECSIDLPTGQLQISTVSVGDVANWRVPPGSYRLRASFGRLAEIDQDDMEDNDHYRVVLWPGSAIELSVLKQWTAPR